VSRHFQCEQQELGRLKIEEKDGALRGWSIAPEGTITDLNHEHYGAKVLSLTHVRRRAIDPAIIVYFVERHTMGVLPRRSFKIDTQVVFTWSSRTRLMRLDWVCHPIHGQDYCAFDVQRAQTFPVGVFDTGTTATYLDHMRVGENGTITARDLHDVSKMDLPIEGDPHGSSIFLAFAATAMTKLKEMRAYLNLNVEPVNTGRSRQTVRLYNVSALVICLCVCVWGRCINLYVMHRSNLPNTKG